jgi:hypothetical protein
MRKTLVLVSLIVLMTVYATRASAQGDEQPKVIAKQDVVYSRIHGAGLLAPAHPEGQGPVPVIISVYGSRWVGSHKSDPSEGTIDVSQWAGFGFFAMSVDYRLGGPAPPRTGGWEKASSDFAV